MKYELSDLVDLSQLQKLLESFYTATGIASYIISRDGTILTTTGGLNICTKFHSANSKSQLCCIQNNKYILDQFKNGTQIVNFKCKNGLINIGIPIIVEDNFLATLFIGQVFFENPDWEYFKRQAKEFGFNEKDYIKALKEVPIVNKNEYEKKLQFLKDLAQMISEIGLKQLKFLENQRELEISQERYKLSLYASNDGIWHWNFINNELSISNRFAEILGYTREEIIYSLTTSFEKLIHPDDLHLCREYFYKNINNKTSDYIHELRIKSKCGIYKWVLVRGYAILNSTGIPIRMSGSLTDLSDKKSAEEQLKKEQYFSKAIIDTANIIISLWTPDGNLVDFNNYGQKISGYTKEEVLGKGWMNTLWPSELTDETLNFISSFNEDKLNTQVEGLLITKKGSSRTILWSNQILKNEDGSTKNIIGLGLDITERKNEEKRLTEFFANISHELKTPLNIIFSVLQLEDFYIKNDLMNKNTFNYINHRKSMKQNCYRLLRLVNNLIDITKIDAGYLELNVEEYNIVNLIESIALSITHYAENKGLTLIFDTDIEEKIIYCDPDKIERIILNLLSNAIKFTNPGDNIFINLHDNNQSIIISVKDTGIGIEQDKLNIIFERFKQVNKSLNRNHEGSGIGLSLVKSFVEMHNGSLEVKSTPGKGSEFKIELPVNKLNTEKKDCTASEDLYTKQKQNIEKINIEFSDIYFD